jgi:hypothetical protein
MKLIDQSQAKKVHFNWPQRRGALVRARIEAFIGSRGVGKTQGFASERLSWNAFRMKRSLGGLVVPSFKKFFTQFIPSLYNGLQALGYEEGRDYVIGEEGPREWLRPYNRIYDWEYALHWRCGSALAFISQDRVGSGNGLSLDYVGVEEAKLVDDKRFQEDTVPAIRGNKQHFGDMSEHGSMFFVTDRPTNRKGKWIYTYREQMDKELLAHIWRVLIRKQELEQAIQSGRLAATTVADYTSEVTKAERLLNELRKDCVYYHEGSILDNIDVIGLEKLVTMDRAMDPSQFDAAVLNYEVDFVDGPFYADFDEDTHCYLAGITPFTAARGYTHADQVLDSRDDGEIMAELPLDIGMDFGGKFNCMAVGQQYDDLLRIDRGFHAVQPAMTVDVVGMFIRHFRFHKNKKVYFFHDHTSLQHHGISPYCYRDVVVDALRAAGWEVIPVFIGTTPAPKLRHVMWSQLLRSRPCPVMWNRDNCEDMIASIRLTAIREGRNGLEKDKSAEGGAAEDQVHAPHYGDACDTLVYGRVHTLSSRVDLPMTTLFLP